MKMHVRRSLHVPLLEESESFESPSLVIDGKTNQDFVVDDGENGRLDKFTHKAFDYVTDRLKTKETLGLQE